MRIANRMKFCLWICLTAPGCAVSRGGASNIKEAYAAQDLQFFFPDGAPPTTVLDKLPRTSKLSPTPWNGHYWPSYRWGLLRRQFQETRSPLEKFEAAFRDVLIGANPGYSPGDLAALERQRVTGVTTNWFGICDGESEEALVFPEPRSIRMKSRHCSATSPRCRTRAER